MSKVFQMKIGLLAQEPLFFVLFDISLSLFGLPKNTNKKYQKVQIKVRNVYFDF